ncbi:hypothetical protein HAX54_007484, partial [Datura stramonium]|nr:hypothetical protein [Datura stramonium]
MEHNKLLVPVEEMMNINTLVVVLMNYDGDGVPGYTELVNALEAMGSYNFRPKIASDYCSRFDRLASRIFGHSIKKAQKGN